VFLDASRVAVALIVILSPHLIAMAMNAKTKAMKTKAMKKKPVVEMKAMKAKTKAKKTKAMKGTKAGPGSIISKLKKIEGLIDVDVDKEEPCDEGEPCKVINIGEDMRMMDDAHGMTMGSLMSEHYGFPCGNPECTCGKDPWYRSSEARQLRDKFRATTLGQLFEDFKRRNGCRHGRVYLVHGCRSREAEASVRV
jgi:hypothetical protein